MCNYTFHLQNVTHCNLIVKWSKSIIAEMKSVEIMKDFRFLSHFSGSREICGVDLTCNGMKDGWQRDATVREDFIISTRVEVHGTQHQGIVGSIGIKIHHCCTRG